MLKDDAAVVANAAIESFLCLHIILGLTSTLGISGRLQPNTARLRLAHAGETNRLLSPTTDGVFASSWHRTNVRGSRRRPVATPRNKETPMHIAHSKQRAPGDLDPSFGIDGLVDVREPQTGLPMQISALSLDGLGRILVCGRTFTAESVVDNYLIRLNRDGVVDGSFGVDGSCLLPRSNESTIVEDLLSPEAISTAADGSMIVLGRIEVFTIDKDRRYVVPAASRVMVDGSLDRSFGSLGLAIYRPPHSLGHLRARPTQRVRAGSDARVAGARGMPDGSVFFAADIESGTTYLTSYILKISRSGHPDRSFGIDGFVEIRDLVGIGAHGLDVDDRHRVIVAGATGRIGALVRLNPDGRPDESFGSNGRVEFPTSAPGGCRCFDVKALFGEKLLVTTVFNEAPNPPAPWHYRTGVLRLMANGQPDVQFNNGEQVLLDFLPNGYVGQSLAVDAGSRLLIEGWGMHFVGGVMWRDFVMTRLFPNGLIDISFGYEGSVVFDHLGMRFGAGIGIQDGQNLIFAAVAGDRGDVVGRLFG